MVNTLNEDRIVIRTNPDVKQKWRELAVKSGTKNYNDFTEKLLELYEVVSRKRGMKNIANLVYYEKIGVDIKY